MFMLWHDHISYVVPCVVERVCKVKFHNAEEGAFWDVMPCGSCKNRCFGGTWRLHQDD
jgi:hypothetical protein